MRPFDRDFYMSTISVLQEQRRIIQSIADDMCMRLDELQDVIATEADQEEDRNYDTLLNDSWQSGYDYCMWEEDKVVYDSSRKKYCTCEGAEPKKECMCDDCWSDTTGSPDYRMD